MIMSICYGDLSCEINWSSGASFTNYFIPMYEKTKHCVYIKWMHAFNTNVNTSLMKC